VDWSNHNTTFAECADNPVPSFNLDRATDTVVQLSDQ